MHWRGYETVFRPTSYPEFSVCTVHGCYLVRQILPLDPMRNRGTCRQTVSVCLFVTQSVCHNGVLYRNGLRYHKTSFSAKYHYHSMFINSSAVTRGTPSAWVLNSCRQICDFRLKSPFIWERYEIVPWLLWKGNMKS